MKHPLLFFLTLYNLTLSAQDTTWYDKDWNKVNRSGAAAYYELLQQDTAGGKRVWNSFYISGKRRSERSYRGNLPDGKHLVWYENGQLHKEINYRQGNLHGALLTFWENGQSKRIDEYVEGILKEGKCLDRDGVSLPYVSYEIRPAFPGGQVKLREYLSKTLKYPVAARKEGMEGRVTLSFVVNTDGSISFIKVVESVSQELDAEAIRVVSNMPAWNPGRIDNEPWRFSYKLPVNFRLGE